MMLETCAPGEGCKESKPLYRGPANRPVVIPAWVRYMWLEDLRGQAQSYPVNEGADGSRLAFIWWVGQVIPVKGGCGGGMTLWLDGSAQREISIWGTSSRQEAYESSVRSYP